MGSCRWPRPESEARYRNEQTGNMVSEANQEDSIIRLDDFLKYVGFVGTGGEAKVRIQSGEAKVNGEVETRRRKQLSLGDVVEFDGETITVEPMV